MGKLTDIFVKRASTAGRYGDGDGLNLLIDKRGGKSWMLRTVVKGSRRDIGLGGVSWLSLAQARVVAADMRRVARSGGDPIADRREKQRKAEAPTFAVLARQVHAQVTAGGRNGKHKDQWINTLVTHAFPVLGSIQVCDVQTADVLKVLSPIWTTKPETARRVHQRLGVIFDWAKAHGHRTGDSPMSGVKLGLPKWDGDVEHFAALPYENVVQFVEAVRGGRARPVTKLALEFMVLTASRTKPVRMATWGEINFDKREWTVQADSMKAGEVFVVPLSDRAVAVLQEAKAIVGRRTDGLIFPGPAGWLSENALNDQTKKTCAVLGLLAATGHGMRTTFKSFALEQTNFANEVSDRALAHSVKDASEAAYARSDLRAKRAKLMQVWSDYVTGAAGEESNVVPFAARA